jgi:hypothetical protein
MIRTSVLYQHTDHPLFNEIINSKARGKFVVVDPMDSDGLLYLNRREYLETSKNCMANQVSLEVLARPEDDLVGIRPDQVSGDRTPSSSGYSVRSNSDGSGTREYHTSAFNGTRHNPLSCFLTVIHPSELDFPDGFGREAWDKNLRLFLMKWGEILMVRVGIPSRSKIILQIQSVATYMAHIARAEGAIGGEADESRCLLCKLLLSRVTCQVYPPLGGDCASCTRAT